MRSIPEAFIFLKELVLFSIWPIVVQIHCNAYKLEQQRFFDWKVPSLPHQSCTKDMGAHLMLMKRRQLFYVLNLLGTSNGTLEEISDEGSVTTLMRS